MKFIREYKLDCNPRRAVKFALIGKIIINHFTKVFLGSIITVFAVNLAVQEVTGVSIIKELSKKTIYGDDSTLKLMKDIINDIKKGKHNDYRSEI